MNEIITAIVLVLGISSTELRQNAQDFANLYADRGSGIELSLHTHATDVKNHIVVLERPSEFYLFQYLVNYLTYPMHRDTQHRPRGYWTLKQGELPISVQEGMSAMVFIPESDAERDNVYLVTEDGTSMILGFALGHEYLEIPKGQYMYEAPQIDFSQYQNAVKVRSVPMFLQRPK